MKCRKHTPAHRRPEVLVVLHRRDQRSFGTARKRGSKLPTQHDRPLDQRRDLVEQLGADHRPTAEAGCRAHGLVADRPAPAGEIGEHAALIGEQQRSTRPASGSRSAREWKGDRASRARSAGRGSRQARPACRAAARSSAPGARILRCVRPSACAWGSGSAASAHPMMPGSSCASGAPGSVLTCEPSPLVGRHASVGCEPRHRRSQASLR